MEKEMDAEIAPTVLGAVAGTLRRDEEVLTGSWRGTTVCDWMTDYARPYTQPDEE